MKATYKTKSGQLMFEVVSETPKGVFKEIAAIQEIFDAEQQCGKCGGKHIKFIAREVEGNDFYELQCEDCDARFQFGQRKKGGDLFPKRRGENGPLPNGGWAVYRPKDSAAA
jgi:hypothetical protein